MCYYIVSPAQGLDFKKRPETAGQIGNYKFGQKEAAASSTGSKQGRKHRYRPRSCASISLQCCQENISALRLQTASQFLHALRTLAIPHEAVCDTAPNRLAFFQVAAR